MDFSKVKEWQIPEGKVASVSVGGVVIWQAKTQAEQLTAPTISLDGSTLTMTATDDRTQELVIFVDGVETATVANLISFTIAGTQYKSEAGMTWGEWVESEYNTGGFIIGSSINSGEYYTITTTQRDYTVAFNSNTVFSTDVINENEYQLITLSGGGGVN
jgi:hypothetical protein